ncbi:MAG: D-alanyl-D-alanine carboxypeptidase family protein, partial [Burkholderiales bacterium]
MKFLYFLIAACAAATAGAQTAAPAPLPPIPTPTIEARAYLLLDVNSGQVLASRNAGDKFEPASLTKLMTAYLVFGALKQKSLKPEQVVPVSTRAWKAEGSRMFIEPKKPVTVDELLRGMIIQSGNDASIALAEVIGGSEEAFAEMMNREAKRLGLANTNFTNATGLTSPQLHSTAEDLAKLVVALIRDYPEHYPLYSQKEYRYNNITQANRNRLLWLDPAVDGVKTGYTENAGYCLVTSAKRGERRLVSVVLGTVSESARAAESQKLLNWGFQAYDSVRLYARNQPV